MGYQKNTPKAPDTRYGREVYLSGDPQDGPTVFVPWGWHIATDEEMAKEEEEEEREDRRLDEEAWKRFQETGEVIDLRFSKAGEVRKLSEILDETP